MQATLNAAAGRYRRLAGPARISAALLMVLAALLLYRAAPMAAGADLRSVAAVLVMVHDPGCPYCARWEAEVERSYMLSQEGKFAPLAKRLRGHPDIASLKKIVYSPTFVMLAYGEEVGRIIGYQGPDLFWTELEPLVAKAGFVPAAAAQ
jgi:hypothetical protein